MNLLDGRILHEVRLLVGAMKDARLGDKTIPFVRSLLLRKSHRKKAAKPTEAEGKAAKAEAVAPSKQVEPKNQAQAEEKAPEPEETAPSEPEPARS